MPHDEDRKDPTNVGTTSTELSYDIDAAGRQVPSQSCEVEKDLEIHVHHQLTYSAHIKEAITKSNQILGMVRRAHQYLDAKVMMYLYKGLIRPTREANAGVWGGCLGSISPKGY